MIASALADPPPPRLAELYENLREGQGTIIVETLAEALTEAGVPTAETARIGTWLATTAPDPKPVSLGILLLGIAGDPDRDLLLTIGAHPAFTTSAISAFTITRPDPEADIYTLARRVDSWGRVYCVEQLRDTTNPEIAHWLLTEGFRASGLDNYIAYICATVGDLAGAIEESEPDRDVLTGAGAILWALLPPGPAESIDDYGPAPTVIARWLHHMDHRGDTIHDFLTIKAIRHFCISNQDWPTRIDDGLWTTEQHAAVVDHATALLADDRWIPLVETDLDAEDDNTFSSAVSAATALDIDTFDRLLTRISADPLNGRGWHAAWAQAHNDPARVRTLVDLTRNLPGPGDHHRVRYILHISVASLRHHPGVGADLVTTGLRRPWDDTRHAALGTLETWGATHIDDRQRELIEAIAAAETDEPDRPRRSSLQTLPEKSRALLETIDSGT